MKKTVLLVEDEEDTADLLRQILEQEGYTVAYAKDGRQALILIETMVPTAIVLLDMIVPYANGFELLAALRRNAEWQRIPIIMVSANSYGPDIHTALEQGATGYVVKADGPREMAVKIRRVLSSLAPATEADTEVTAAAPAARPRTRAKRKPRRPSRRAAASDEAA